MEKLLINEEDIIMKIKVRKIVTDCDVHDNFMKNFTNNFRYFNSYGHGDEFKGGGDIASNINIILTNDFIYFEEKGHMVVGYKEETRSVDKIALDDIIEFKVSEKDLEEIININTPKGKLSFTRDNSKGDSLALALSKVIEDLK